MKTSIEYAWVIGSDLDRASIRGQLPGDRVLCEMNGARVFSNLHPLVSEQPWIVVSNDDTAITLQHKSHKKKLRLQYDSLIKADHKEPAVFLIKDKSLSPGPIYVVLQFAQHRIPISDIDKTFPVAFDAESVLKIARQQVIDKLVMTIRDFDVPGWGYRSVCRFALRSNVRAKTIIAFHDADWKKIYQQTDETLIKILKEMNWIPYLLEQNADPMAALSEQPCDHESKWFKE